MRKNFNFFIISRLKLKSFKPFLTNKPCDTPPDALNTILIHSSCYLCKNIDSKKDFDNYSLIIFVYKYN